MATQLSISVSARSRAPRSTVFALLTDATTWSTWTPFSEVSVEEPGGPSGVGAVKRTRYRGAPGRERVLSLTPGSQLSYAYVSGVLSPYIRDYVAVVDLEESGSGTVIHWHSAFRPRFPGSGWLPRRIIQRFLQRCADGLAAHAEEPAGVRGT
jgi:uncharacterized protein YndB with AHSA1/START domain